MSRSSRPDVLCKKQILRNFAKFTGKRLCRSLLFNKVAGLRYLPVNFVKFLRTPFYIPLVAASECRFSAAVSIKRTYLSRFRFKCTLPCNIITVFFITNISHVTYFPFCDTINNFWLKIIDNVSIKCNW